ncbi:hypothetical protein NDU88_003873 [Pleurodeles waltl]|uniref:Uncharacterized protein n=1 Tax=Pleurodeles waltl TaxID=8319 RepID=A0AAV7NI88_PLEWA|nr:hypothetical protein NDU88_003873 [Pleurodeles waltl]
MTALTSTISRVAAPGLQLPVASAAARGSDAAPAPGGAYKSPRGRRSGGEAALNSPEPRHPCHHCHRYRQESRAAITALASTISRIAAPGLQLPVASAAARASDAAPAPGGAYKSPRGRRSGGGICFELTGTTPPLSSLPLLPPRVQGCHYRASKYHLPHRRPGTSTPGSLSGGARL